MPRGNNGFTTVLSVQTFSRPSRLNALFLSLFIIALPAHGQISDAKVEALVQALRLVTPRAAPA